MNGHFLKTKMKNVFLVLTSIALLTIMLAGNVFSQAASAKADEKAEAILARAVQNLGGDRYLKATSQYGRGKYSGIRDNAVASFQTFVDVIVFPDKERTEFKSLGVKTVQTNVGNGGWVFDGDQERI